MSLFLDDGDVRLHQGDVRDVLAELPAESVHCVVTSPPYWGLRDYGTGAWEGGDPDCDHAVRQDPRVESSTLGGGKSTTGHQREGFKDQCPRCGASRVDNQLGLEPTPDLYLDNMVQVFREVRRVLRSDGTCWVNMGDSYGAGSRTTSAPQTVHGGEWRDKNPGRVVGVQSKQLCMIPARLALALQADGWWLRSQIVWSKPNPMPESVTDRPTTSHEFVYLLAKSPRYFFDQEAVREQFDARPQQRLTALKDQPLAAAREAAGVAQGNPQGGAHVSRFAVQEETLVCGCVEAGCGRAFHEVDCGCACHAEVGLVEGTEPNGDASEGEGQREGLRGLPEAETPAPGRSGEAHSQRHQLREAQVTLDGSDGEAPRGPDGRRKTSVQGQDGSFQHRDGERWPNLTGRNIRSVWEIPTQPYPEAHFATYPEELVRRCILAGTSERGCCPECGAPWVREVERESSYDHTTRQPTGLKDRNDVNGEHDVRHGVLVSVKTTGWRPSCECGAIHDVVFTPSPCTVLDPFMGSGTTALVARNHGRNAIGVELNPDYCALAARRLQQLSLLAVQP